MYIGDVYTTIISRSNLLGPSGGPIHNQEDENQKDSELFHQVKQVIRVIGIRTTIVPKLLLAGVLTEVKTEVSFP